MKRDPNETWAWDEKHKRRMESAEIWNFPTLLWLCTIRHERNSETGEKINFENVTSGGNEKHHVGIMSKDMVQDSVKL